MVGNQYIDERVPWSLIKDNREEAALVIRTCINLIRLYAIASSPLIPFTSQKLFDALHLKEADRMSKLSNALKLDA
jgi:methionyl-tRNA synthetase